MNTFPCLIAEAVVAICMDALEQTLLAGAVAQTLSQMKTI